MAASILLLACVVPPLGLVGRELTAGGGSLGLLADAGLWLLLLRSIALAASVTGLALLVGAPLGVLFARAALPFGGVLFAAHVAVVFLPPLLPALGWFQMFGREGLFGNDITTRILFSDAGAVLVLAACFTPIVTALTALGVSAIDASLEEAARIAAGPLRAVAFVLLPGAGPVIALSAIVVFTLAFSELGVPMFLGVDVYPAVVFSRLGGMDFAPGEAAAFALPLVGVAGVLLWLERRWAGGRATGVLGRPLEPRGPLFAPGAAAPILAAAAAGLSLAPLLALFAHASLRGGIAELALWMGAAPWNSVQASLIAAALMTTAAVVLGHALARRRRSGRWLDAAATLAFIIPSSILGVGLVLAWNRPATNWLYASAAILVVAFIARYGAVALRAFAVSIMQIPASLEEAARASGASYLRRISLLLGMARRGLAASFALAMVFCLRDLETASLFYPPGGEPLTVRIFTLEANGPPAVVSALAALHVVLTLTIVAAAWAFMTRPASAP